MTDQYDPNGYTSYGGPPGGESQTPGGGQPAGGYGSYGNYGQGYGQPGAPSQPYQGYGHYGQPGAPSQPYQGTPSQPYPGQQYPGPMSQPLYGQQTVFTQPPAPKKSRRGLKIALTVGAIVLVLGGLLGGTAIFLLNQFAAPGVAALKFCNDLKSQSYDSAYSGLSSDLQARFSKTSFSAGVASLDTAEGKVTGCQQAQGNGAYNYSLGASSATVGAQLTRATQGNMTGALHLKNQNGSWKIDSIDTSLLGVNIGALQASGAFCAAMQGQDYSAAYDLLDSTQQGLVSRDDFVASGKLHDSIDGSITTCALAKVPQGNNDQLTHLTIQLNRSKLGARTGDVTLKLEDSAWKLDATDAALNGTDLRPLVLGGTFCTLFAAGKYGDAYGLLSSGAQATITKAQFIAGFQTINGYTVKWSCGTPDLTTYTVKSDSASVVIPITDAIATLNFKDTLDTKVEFVLENGVWKIDDLVTLS
ncbi:MAG TPA: hypothetical protein VFX24_04410 [Ktedonobacterales bacterium]|nr:hypothetical protein [Ktedonobacterales bacterium]